MSRVEENEKLIDQLSAEPQETVTEFADRCKECGARYGKLLELKSGNKRMTEELFRNMEEIREVMSCDADAETKCKMISNILTAPPHYFSSLIPIEYVHKYTSNNTTSDEIRNFVEGMISDWEDEDIDVYEHYAEML